MLTEELLYRNVEKGMREAPEKMKTVYADPFLRVVLEALILDGNRAPAQLYSDLFTLTFKEANDYAEYFFDLGDFRSRIHFYHYLQTLNGNDFIVKSRVFDEGWESIDLIFNKGNNIVVSDVARETYVRATMYALREVRSKLSDMSSLVLHQDSDREELSMNRLKELLNVAKDATRLFPKESSENKVEQLMFEFKRVYGKIKRLLISSTLRLWE